MTEVVFLCGSLVLRGVRNDFSHSLSPHERFHHDRDGIMRRRYDKNEERVVAEACLPKLEGRLGFTLEKCVALFVFLRSSYLSSFTNPTSYVSSLY